MFSAGILRTRGILQMRTFALFDVKKLRIFRNLWCVCVYGQESRGIEPVQTFFGKGERFIFPDVVRTSFMDGSLVVTHFE